MTLDANILIAYLSGDATIIEQLSEWRRQGRTLFLSTIVETEVLSFPSWTEDEYRATQLFLAENFTSIPFDRLLAHTAADIRRVVRIKFPDAAIAATALFTGTTLVTRNLRDFRKIPKLTLLRV